MARATRSTTVQQLPTTPTTSGDSLIIQSTKKRKRNSIDTLTGPPTKQPRQPPKHKDAADLPLTALDATKILTVLEAIDAQGLLDRIVHVPSEQSSQPLTRSLRSLFEHPEQQTLRELRATIQPLFPISAHPRTKPSAPAVEQYQFYSLALSLIDQASTRSISLDRDSVFHDDDDRIADPDKDRKVYALLQHLPTGDWWSSTTAVRDGQPGLTSAEAEEMATGQGELVAILPSLPIPPTDLPKLGDLRPHQVPLYRPKTLDRSAAPLIKPRKISTGRFLDYGSYASFAPTFESDGVEVGSDMLGEVVYDRGLRKKAKLLREKMIKQAKAKAKAAPGLMEVDQPSKEQPKEEPEIDWETFDLFPADQIAALKAGMADLELDASLNHLLQQNATALRELAQMQRARLSFNKKVEPGGDEEHLAQQITSSLALLTSLRPRTTSTSSLIPSPAILRALHRSLPSAPTSGWQGTLLATAATALHDDSTIRVKPGALRATAPAAAAPTPTSSMTNGISPIPATPQYMASAYRPQPYSPTITTQVGYSPAPQAATNYYPNAYLQAPPPGQHPAHYGYHQYYAGMTPRQDYAGYYGNYTAAGYTPYATTPSAQSQQMQMQFTQAHHMQMQQPPGSRAVPNLVKPPAQTGWAMGYASMATPPPATPTLKRQGTTAAVYPNQSYGR